MEAVILVTVGCVLLLWALLYHITHMKYGRPVRPIRMPIETIVYDGYMYTDVPQAVNNEAPVERGFYSDRELRKMRGDILRQWSNNEITDDMKDQLLEILREQKFNGF